MSLLQSAAIFMRYSHVFRFPDNKHPFDKPEFRWPSFVGEFVAPLVKDKPDLLFWFSYYTTEAKFRVHLNGCVDFEPDLIAARDRLGLIDTGQELTYALEQDLGCDRFRGPNSQSGQKQRAFAILRSLKAVSDLVIESIFKRADGYWEFEENANKGLNPVGNHLFSVTHLYHNMTGADGVVYTFEEANQKTKVLSFYYFNQMMNDRTSQGQSLPSKVQGHRVLL